MIWLIQLTFHELDPMRTRWEIILGARWENDLFFDTPENTQIFEIRDGIKSLIGQWHFWPMFLIAASRSINFSRKSIWPFHPKTGHQRKPPPIWRSRYCLLIYVIYNCVEKYYLLGQWVSNPTSMLSVHGSCDAILVHLNSQPLHIRERFKSYKCLAWKSLNYFVIHAMRIFWH